jgi:GAF domain-containing protein
MITNEFSNWVNNKKNISTEEWLRQGLKLCCDFYKMETGIISQIDGKKYIIKAVYSSLGKIFTPDMEFELQDTYCAQVEKYKKIITYQHVGQIEEMLLHPVYVALQLESYIGIPLFKDGMFMGTLNFTSHEVRKNPFTKEEINIAKHMALKVQEIVF